MFADLKAINKRLSTAGLRLSNAVDNLLDMIILPFLLALIGLISFGFNFSFSPTLLYQAASILGIEPFSFISEKLTVDLQMAAVTSGLNSTLAALSLITFIWLRRRIMTPLTRGEFALLLLFASPIPLSLIVGAVGLQLCIFPLAELSSDGAIMRGESKDSFHFCEPLIDGSIGDNLVATYYGVFKMLYAIALIPLSLAVLSSVSLISFKGKIDARFGLHSLT